MAIRPIRRRWGQKGTVRNYLSLRARFMWSHAAKSQPLRLRAHALLPAPATLPYIPVPIIKYHCDCAMETLETKHY